MFEHVSITLNLILPIIGCVQLIRALYKSYLMQAKLIHKSNDLESHGLIYLLAEDKALLRRVARIVIILLFVCNSFLVTWSLSRIIANFAPYSTDWITATALLFHLVMLIVAQLIFMIYNVSDLSFFKKIKL